MQKGERTKLHLTAAPNNAINSDNNGTVSTIPTPMIHESCNAAGEHVLYQWDRRFFPRVQTPSLFCLVVPSRRRVLASDLMTFCPVTLKHIVIIVCNNFEAILSFSRKKNMTSIGKCVLDKRLTR